MKSLGSWFFRQRKTQVGKKKQLKNSNSMPILTGRRSNHTAGNPRPDLPPRHDLLNEATKVFGVSLRALHQRSGSSVPVILTTSYGWLNTHGLKADGIWRRPGNHAIVNAFRDRWDRGEIVEFSPTESSYNICSLIKLYLKNLPCGMLEVFVSTKHRKCLIDAAYIEDQSFRLETLKQLVTAMPHENYDTLKTIIHHFHLLLQNQSQTQMSAKTLAMCFFPRYANLLETLTKNYTRIFQTSNEASQSPSNITDIAHLSKARAAMMPALETFSKAQDISSARPGSPPSPPPTPVDQIGAAATKHQIVLGFDPDGRCALPPMSSTPANLTPGSSDTSSSSAGNTAIADASPLSFARPIHRGCTSSGRTVAPPVPVASEPAVSPGSAARPKETMSAVPADALSCPIPSPMEYLGASLIVPPSNLASIQSPAEAISLSAEAVSSLAGLSLPSRVKRSSSLTVSQTAAHAQPGSPKLTCAPDLSGSDHFSPQASMTQTVPSQHADLGTTKPPVTFTVPISRLSQSPQAPCRADLPRTPREIELESQNAMLREQIAILQSQSEKNI